MVCCPFSKRILKRFFSKSEWRIIPSFNLHGLTRLISGWLLNTISLCFSIKVDFLSICLLLIFFFFFFFLCCIFFSLYISFCFSFHYFFFCLHFLCVF